jgi:peptidyl-prolyl cis-trans isomerase C
MRRHILAVLGLPLALAACKTGADSKVPEEGVLARVDDKVITDRDLADAIKRYEHLPFVRARYSVPDRRRELLDNLVRFEVLAAEARRRGYGRDPDVQQVAKQSLVAQFEKQEITDKLRPEDVPQADVEAYYRDHRNDFMRPEQVRASQILVRDKAKAETVASAARGLAPGDAKGFAALVARHSEDEDSKSRQGDLMLLDRSATRVPKPVVDAAFTLQKPGEIGGPVVSDAGFHVLRLAERLPAAPRTLEEATPDIRRRLVDELRAKRRRELVDEARKHVKIEIYQDQLAKLDIPAPSAAPNPSVPDKASLGEPSAPAAAPSPAPGALR